MTKNEIETKVEELFTRICKGVIQYNNHFTLKKTFSGASLTKYNICCHAADSPRILGKGGDRFQALRLLMRIVGAKYGRQMKLETMEKPTIGAPAPFPKFKYNPKWPREQIKVMLQDICDNLFADKAEVGIVEATGSAILTVRHGIHEPFAESVAPALENIFNGVGTTNGCNLSVDMGAKE